MIRLLPFLLILALAALLWSSGLAQRMSLAALIEARDALEQMAADHLFLTAAAFVSIFMAMVAMAVPVSPLLTMASGFLFGPLLGAVLSVSGSTLGGALLFLAARTGFSSALYARLGAGLQAFAKGMREDAAAYMLFSRIVIFFPSWFVNIGAGLVGIRLATFLWTTALGIFPVTLAFAFVGAGLEKALSGEIDRWRACHAAQTGPCHLDINPLALLRPEIFVALTMLAGLTLLSALWRRRQRMRG